MDILQRERLGGVALVRNQHLPGHIVSWRFADDAAAERVAILLPQATASKFRVIAYNMGADAAAAMTGWGVTAGRWTMTRATSSDGGATLVADGPAQTVTLERSASVPVRFTGGTTTIYDFTLVEAGTPVGERPDLAIGADDVVVKGDRVAVTVHSLGAKPASGGRVEVIDADDRVLATASVPDLAAPLDLTPQTAVVRLAAAARRGGGAGRVAG